MKKILLAVLALSVTGCSGPTPPAPSNHAASNGPILKQFLSRTDMVLVKHFFPADAVFATDKGEYISPGHVELGPVIAYQPGHEADRKKGIRIEVVSTYVRENEYSHPNDAVSFLDEHEAKDLSSALGYMQQVNQAWSTAEPSDDVEIMFASKDDFHVSLLPDAKNGNSLYVESGNAALNLPVAFASDLKQKLDSEIETLDSNEK